MKIGLIDVDGHGFPNLALMKLSAWHKAQGDSVEWWWGFGEYDRVYMSKVFDASYSEDVPEPVNCAELIKGGTGYGLDNSLPEAAEHMMPDYGLYHQIYPETRTTAYGFLTRGCPRHCDFCVVGDKEGLRSRKVADLSEWWNGQKNIELMDPNLLACPDHMDLLRQLAESGAKVNINQGMDCRILTKENIEALNKVKVKMIHFAWDFMRFEEPVVRGLCLYAKLGGGGEPPQQTRVRPNQLRHHDGRKPLSGIQNQGAWFRPIHNDFRQTKCAEGNQAAPAMGEQQVHFQTVRAI